MSHRFVNFNLPELQTYLRKRGITVSGYNKPALIDIAVAADKLQLPTDPDLSSDSTTDVIKNKLQQANLSTYITSDPLKINGYTEDFSSIPEFGLIDIFNYLIFSKSEYDGKKLKGYKSFEDYRLFSDGHVISLLFNEIHEESKSCIFKAKVKPTQRDKTYLQKEYYELWFVVDKKDGSVITGYCECKGGADGACRHLAASLYELEAFEVKSCTGIENVWKRKSRQSDKAIDIRSMNIVAARYNSRDFVLPPNKPFSDLYDPRTESQRTETTEEQKKEFGLRLKEISGNAQALDILLHPDDIEMEEITISTDPPEEFSISHLAKKFSEENCINSVNFNEMCQSFFKCLNFTSTVVHDIQTRTIGQASNELWFKMRTNLLTASNFEQAAKYIDKGREPSETFISSILGENRLNENFLPPPLKWGRRKESIARAMYNRLQKHCHKNFKIIEKGLLLSQVYPCLGCSIDGTCSCKCKPAHNDWSIEIKCPFSKRNQNPKDVAIEKKCVLDRSTGHWMVTAECPYYAQMQGQLGLYGYRECDLVIYTSLGIHVSRMIFDPKYFSDMAEKLSLFYIKYVVPRVLQPYL